MTSAVDITGTLNSQLSGLKTAHSNLQTSIKNSATHLLNQAALYNVTSDVTSDIENRIEKIEDTKNYNHRVMEQSHNANLRMRAYTSILMNLLGYIFFVLFLFYLGNRFILGKSTLQLIFMVVTFFYGIYMFYKVNDFFRRSKQDFSRYEFAVEPKLLDSSITTSQ